MQINPIYFYVSVAISLFMTYLFVKRLKNNGCFTFGYIVLIIFSVNSFTAFSGVLLVSSITDAYTAMTSGQQYEATVVSFTSEKHHDSENNKSYMMLTPTLQFTTGLGETIEKKLDFSTSQLKIGDKYSVNYNAENDTIITLGFTMVIKLIGAFIFSFIFTFTFIGIVIYVLGYPIKGYLNFISKIGFYFFIPFLMLGFSALLIYGAFYGNEIPKWVTAILIFFSVVLALAAFVYLKFMLTKGVPQTKPASTKKWLGNWENRPKNRRS